MSRKKSMPELGRMTSAEYQEAQKIPVAVVLDNVRSGHNVGSVFRTVDGLRLEQIILCGITPTPPQRDILKTALGATETVEWKKEKSAMDALAALKASGYSCWSIEQVVGSVELMDWSFVDGPVALFFGNEVRGVEQEVVSQSDGCIEIAQYGTKHSFNVSVCAGIVLHHVSNLYRIDR